MSRNSKNLKQRNGQWQENNGKFQLLSQFSWGKPTNNKLKKRWVVKKTGTNLYYQSLSET